MLLASWLLSDDGAWGWTADALLNVGSAVLLFAPLLVVTEWLFARRIRTLEADAVETRETIKQTQREVGDVQSAISDLIDYNTQEGREEAARQLDEKVRSHMFAEHNALSDSYAKLVTETEREPFLRALRSAIDRDLVTADGPRVELLYSELHLRFAPRDDGTIDLVIESDGGRVLSTVNWSDGDVGTVLGEVSIEASTLPGFDGMDKFFAGQAPKELAETLLYAARHGPLMTGSHDIQRVIEITEGGWIITERGLVPKSVLSYLIRFEGASPIDWDEHILNKGWPESYHFPATMRWAMKLHQRRVVKAEKIKTATANELSPR